MSTDDPAENTVVLVVEDEVLIREDIIDVLERSGFVALRADNVGEALSELAARPDIQAVFTDIQMSGVRDGLDLARLVATHRPDIAVLITSGRSCTAPDEMPATSRFLPKPYMPRTVVSILREMLAEDPGGWEPGFGHSHGDPGSSASPR